MKFQIKDMSADEDYDKFIPPQVLTKLQKNRVLLIENLQPDLLYDQLIQDGVLKSWEVEEIKVWQEYVNLGS